MNTEMRMSFAKVLLLLQLLYIPVSVAFVVVTRRTTNIPYHDSNCNIHRDHHRKNVLTSKHYGVQNVLDTPNNDTFAPTNNNKDDNDVVLKEFDKKEAMILKRRNDIQAKLQEYDAVITQIQTQKAEYIAASQLSKPPVGGSFSETTLRSAVKAFVWRIIAGAVTFITTYQYSNGSIQQALQVVGADFFSKSITMFIGERIMNKSQAGRKQGGRDNAQRSLVKALIWRLFAVCNTLTMAIFISKDISIASKIASTDAVFKTALMYFYERVWARINWGKEFLIEFSI